VWHYITIDFLNSYLNMHSWTLDQHEHYDTNRDAKCDDTHKMSVRDNAFVDENEELALVTRLVVASKSSFDSTVAAIALIATIFGSYELSAICVSTVVTASPSPAQPHLWHIRFNLFDCVLLTALVVATTHTVVSLFLRRYVGLICRVWWIEHLLKTPQSDKNEGEEHQRPTAEELGRQRSPLPEDNEHLPPHSDESPSPTPDEVRTATLARVDRGPEYSRVSRTRMTTNSTKMPRAMMLCHPGENHNNQTLTNRIQCHSPHR
jgi:hypothetical protein